MMWIVKICGKIVIGGLLFVSRKKIYRRDLPSNVPLDQAIINLNKEKNAQLDNDTLSKGLTVALEYIIRMSRTTCQLYIACSGTDPINIWRAVQMFLLRLYKLVIFLFAGDPRG